MRFISTIVLVFFCTLSLLQAQQASEAVQIALRYVQDQSTDWQLQPKDMQELLVTDSYSTQKTGTQHVYISQ